MMLETERLLLREFRNDDLGVLASIMGNAEVMRFSLSGPLAKTQTENFLKKGILDHYERLGFGLYAAQHKEDKRLIGYAGLMEQNIDGEKKIELGYRLDPQYWGNGLALEASLAICHYAFDSLNMQELISIIDPLNARSLSVAKKVGMRFWKEMTFHKVPVHIYSLKKIHAGLNP